MPARSPARRPIAPSVSCPPPTMTFSPAPLPPPPRATGPTRWRWATRARTALARQLLQWRYALDRNSGAKFADIDAVIKMARRLAAARHAPCPGRSRRSPPDMQRRRRSSPGSAAARPPPASAASGWAKRWWPRGETAKGAALIRQGWSEGSFDDSTENAILAKDAAYLTPKATRRGWTTCCGAARPTPRGGKWRGWMPEPPPSPRPASRWAPACRMPSRPGQGRRTPTDPALLYDWARQLRAGPSGRRRACHAAASRARTRWRAITPRAGGRKSMSRRATR